jgi:transposase-like protein
VIAHAVHESGRREIIGLDAGTAETEAFWRAFLRSLVARGLSGVQLAISDAHPGLKAALAQVLGVPWQRCTVCFLRDLRGHCRKDQHDVLGALIRPLFTAPSGQEARKRLGDALDQLQGRLPKIAGLLEEAEADILAFYGSRPSITASCARPTRWNGSRARSAATPTTPTPRRFPSSKRSEQPTASPTTRTPNSYTTSRDLTKTGTGNSWS